jgi:hypothetical protein
MKAVVRAFLQEIRIKKTTRQAVLRWLRLPRVDESLKLVELRGVELDRCSIGSMEEEVLALPASARRRR